MAKGIIWFILLGSLYLFSAIILFNTSPVLSSLIFCIGLVHLIFRGVRPALSKWLLVRRTRRGIASSIDEHIPVLARKRSQLVKKDDYGIVHYEEWEQEKEYFISIVLSERFGDILSEDFPLSPDRIDYLIEKGIDAFALEMYMDDIPPEDTEDPVEMESEHSYRQYCSRLLELAGWEVILDGGAGKTKNAILAERDETRMVVMCIDSSSPVGRRAIRRASAARRKLDAEMAAVVSSVGFSRWARFTSSRRHVMTLHHEDLANI